MGTEYVVCSVFLPLEDKRTMCPVLELKAQREVVVRCGAPPQRDGLSCQAERMMQRSRAIVEHLITHIYMQPPQ